MSTQRAVVDDVAVDLSRAERDALLTELEQQVADAVKRGRSTNLVVHAFARTARRFGIGAARRRELRGVRPRLGRGGRPDVVFGGMQRNVARAAEHESAPG